MQNQIYCSICENKLEDACDKVVCHKCFSFICKSCLQMLTKKECPVCRIPYKENIPEKSNPPPIIHYSSIHSNQTTDTRPTINNTSTFRTDASVRPAIVTPDRVTHARSQLTNNSITIVNHIISAQQANYDANLQRAIDNSLITYEDECTRNSSTINDNTEPLGHLNSVNLPRLMVRNNLRRDNSSSRDNSPSRHNQPNWNHLMLNKETGVRTFFHERSHELNGQMSNFAIISTIRKEYEHTPRWKDYINWVKAQRPDVKKDPPIRRQSILTTGGAILPL